VWPRRRSPTEPARPSRWPAPVAVAACFGVTVLGLAGCGSSGHPAAPAGLQGVSTGAAPGSPIAIEDRQAASSLAPAPGSFLAGRTTVSVLGSTTPADGDLNPYAIWPVRVDAGSVRTGDVLVDNFNNRSNDQGTGTTIVDVHPGGRVTTFARLARTVAGCPGGVGLTTAMVQLRTGWVIVGSLPTTNGQITTARAGCLLILSPTGTLVRVLHGSLIDGPWDETVIDDGATASLFVSDTLVGGVTRAGTATVRRGQVVRLTLAQSATRPPHVVSETVVADGLAERADASALVKGPTGLAVGADGTLYVADTVDDRITAVPDAATRRGPDGPGTTLTAGGQLAGPLGITVAPNGDLLAANATNGKVEITPGGHQVGEYYADHDLGQDPPGNGDLFDVAVDAAGTGLLFVDDGTNTLEVLH
jgi:hypothetical protein